MRDTAEWFRARLSEKVRAALAERDQAALRTLRYMMAAIDHAGAISREEVARLTAAPERHSTAILAEASLCSTAHSESGRA